MSKLAVAMLSATSGPLQSSSTSSSSSYVQLPNIVSDRRNRYSTSSTCRATLAPFPPWTRRNSHSSFPHRESLNSKLDPMESYFDPLCLEEDPFRRLANDWRYLWLQVLESASGKQPTKGPGNASAGKGIAAAIEDSTIEFGDFFKGKLPEKFLKLLAWLALSRVGTYIPLSGVDRAAFQGSLDQNSLLGTLDSFSGGGIGRLGICSLGIVPFINAQIVFQLLGVLYPKIQELQKKEGEAGRKKVLQWTRYASIGFAIFQAIGQIVYIRPYVYDFSVEWALTAVFLLTLGSVITTYIGEQISELKLGNGTSFLIFTNIVSYLPASIGRTVVQALNDGNYTGLGFIFMSFFLLVLGIVYVQEAERKIPINYASRYTFDKRGVGKAAYLPFKVNSSGVMPIIFSTSALAAPGALARFTNAEILKNAAVALYPGGTLYLPSNVFLIAFFNYFYTFLQLDPDDVSEQLKRQGASIPAVRPGRATSTFITNVLSRISVLGSAFLGIMAAAPSVVEAATHLTAFRGFAGTSILILVGSATDTARKVQAEIISQKYETIDMYDLGNR
ncbi:hypothetical protein KP509_07G059500 [Ceratopteris richardii]|uniref:CpSecY n=1 Tax=Ceratopteris richardii TaxID=49495 RepID=A0A8T2ULN4_CERRI|nr:hypothetical protein KP509_07G059500 [Ceratopteris richardii]